MSKDVERVPLVFFSKLASFQNDLYLVVPSFVFVLWTWKVCRVGSNGLMRRPDVVICKTSAAKNGARRCWLPPFTGSFV